MTKKEILDYITETPGNTNRAVLGDMLDSFEGGSGSSSDFSTAEVTLANNTGNRGIQVDIPFIKEASEDQPAYATSGINMEENYSVNAILYKGCCTIRVPVIYDITGTGSIITHGSYAEITGDCTVNIEHGET